jgi:hypothetical protein
MMDYRLYLVTDRRWLMGRDLVECVEEAVLGGVTMVQIAGEGRGLPFLLSACLAHEGAHRPVRNLPDRQ